MCISCAHFWLLNLLEFFPILLHSLLQWMWGTQNANMSFHNSSMFPLIVQYRLEIYHSGQLLRTLFEAFSNPLWSLLPISTPWCYTCPDGAHRYKNVSVNHIGCLWNKVCWWSNFWSTWGSQGYLEGSSEKMLEPVLLETLNLCSNCHLSH